MYKILFVGNRNLSRSPMAQFIMQDLVDKAGLHDQFLISSAGGSGIAVVDYTGEPVHRYAQAELAKHGISCEGKRAYKMQPEDYDEFDYIIVMDRKVLRSVIRYIHPETDGKISLLMQYAGYGMGDDDRFDEIYDPDLTTDFSEAYKLIREGCEGLLEHVNKGLKLNYRTFGE